MAKREKIIKRKRTNKKEKKKFVPKKYEGMFTSHAKGFGFVTVEGIEDDFFVPERYTMNAFNGDQVQIETIGEDDHNGKKRTECKVIGITSHATINVVGTFEMAEEFGFVICDDARIPFDIYVPRHASMGAKNNSKVICHITDYGSLNKKPEGEITSILGIKGDVGLDILSVVCAAEIPYEFPEEVLKEAKKTSLKVTSAELKSREDLRDVMMVTIDGADSKDLDDAVSVTKTKNGYELGVHIADVSHYVKEGSALDAEAVKRATSVYLLDRVIPMLPVELSNDICSLNMGEDRLALSCIMQLDENGRIYEFRITESVINIDRRMTYDAVDLVLAKDKKAMKTYKDFVKMFELMYELSTKIRKGRKARGSIDFDMAEIGIELDEKGRPVDVHPYVRGTSSLIIEDFMLSANECVAAFACENDLPIAFRTHDFPNPEKLENLNHTLTKFGHVLRGDLTSIHPRKIAELIEETEGRPEAELAKMLTLRSMQQAVYEVECSGHFGLAAPYYCHYTSPIRRYPDLITHRVIKTALHSRATKGYERSNTVLSTKIAGSRVSFGKASISKKDMTHFKSILPRICEVSSKNERRADGAERQVEKMKKAEYMESYIGEEFDGSVSGLTSWG
ncbi:MAG: ribonuclease R, partial [Lachnospiraceae bacterium]|nr:ribonuclease R [Lachnospiraceae bacterium]